MSEELQPLPPPPRFDTVKAEEKVISDEEKQLLEEIKELQGQTSKDEKQQSSAFLELAELRKEEAEIKASLAELDEKMQEQEKVFKNPAIEKLREQLKPLPIDLQKITEKLTEIKYKFDHDTLTVENEKRMRVEIKNLEKAQVEVQDLKLADIEASRKTYTELRNQKKELLERRMALNDKYEEINKAYQGEREATQSARNENDVVWSQIKEKYAKMDELKKQHQLIFDTYVKQQEAYDELKKQHDEARKQNQEKRKEIEPVLKELREQKIRYIENPLYSCKYDIQKPNFDELGVSHDEELAKAQLINWIDAELSKEIAVEQVDSSSQPQKVKQSDLQALAKKPRKDVKKEVKDKKLIDYSGFEMFGACGLKQSDYTTPEQLRALKEKLSTGNDELQKKKINEIQQKIDDVLGLLQQKGAQWQYVDKVDLPKFERRENTGERRENGNYRKHGENDAENNEKRDSRAEHASDRKKFEKKPRAEKKQHAEEETKAE